MLGASALEALWVYTLKSRATQGHGGVGRGVAFRDVVLNRTEL